MVDRVLQEVRRLQQEGPSADLTNRAKESARRSYETSMKQNGFWLGRLQSAKLLGRDPMLVLHRLERIDAVTPALLQETFKKYFPMDRYTVCHAAAGEEASLAVEENVDARAFLGRAGIGALGHPGRDRPRLQHACLAGRGRSDGCRSSSSTPAPASSVSEKRSAAARATSRSS